MQFCFRNLFNYTAFNNMFREKNCQARVELSIKTNFHPWLSLIVCKLWYLIWIQNEKICVRTQKYFKWFDKGAVWMKFEYLNLKLVLQPQPCWLSTHLIDLPNCQSSLGNVSAGFSPQKSRWLYGKCCKWSRHTWASSAFCSGRNVALPGSPGQDWLSPMFRYPSSDSDLDTFASIS